MKKEIITSIIAIIIISTLFIGCVEENSPKEKTIEDIAIEYIILLSHNNYQQAYSFFNEDMKNAISLEYLEEIWEFYITSYGPFKSINETTRNATMPNFNVIIVNATFQNNYLIVFRIIFNSEKLIAGFWQDEIISLSNYEAPDYVNDSTFSEMDIIFGEEPWTLPATFTIPNGIGPFPSVILIHGSGPNDRDESIGPNKPFKDLAWGLASQGIAVFRYDKRTYLYSKNLTTLSDYTVEDEVIDDVFEAIKTLIIQSYAPIDSIYLVGHSLGAMMIPRIISLNSSEIDGAILLAAPARPLENLILNQTIYLLHLDGEFNEVEQTILNSTQEMVVKIQTLNITNDEILLSASKAYWIYLDTYDQVETAKSIDIPLFFLQGKRDYQITYEDDFQIWNTTLANSSKVSFETYETLNHLFIPGQGESSNIEYTKTGHVDEQVIHDIVEWITSFEEF